MNVLSRILRNLKTEPVADAGRVSLHMMSLWSPLEYMTPKTLSAALNQLRGGDLQAFAQLWDEARLRDDILAAVVPKRAKSVSRLQWEIVTLDEGPEAERQKEIAEAFFNHLEYSDAMDADQSGGVQALVRGMMLAVGHGWSVQEIVWRPSTDGLTASLRQIPLSFFERRTGRLRYLATEGAYDGVDLDEGGWLVTACPDRLGVASLALYLFKHTPLRDWLIYCHRYVVPGLHGLTPAQKGSDDWNDLSGSLANFGQDWAMLTGKDVEVKTIDASSKGELPYPPLVDRSDRRMAVLWRGADLSTLSSADATGASLQQGETDLLTVDDAAMISDTFNRRLLPHVLRYTLGEVRPLIAFRLQAPNPQTNQDLAIDGKLIGWGVEIAKSDLRKRYGRAEPDAGDEIAGEAKPEAGGLKPEGGEPPTTEKTPNAGVPVVRRDPVFDALDADLQPLRARLADALQLPDAEMIPALERLAAEAPDLFRAIDDAGTLPAALARRYAQRFADGIENSMEDQEA